jgi:hypothetical protein
MPITKYGPMDTLRSRIGDLTSAENSFKDISDKIADAHASFVPRAEKRLARTRAARLAAAAGRPRGIDLPPYVAAPHAYTRTGDQGAGNVVTYEPTARPGPTFVELPAAQSGEFKQAISDAKAAHPRGAAVTVYPDYSGMRTFLTPDGKVDVPISGIRLSDWFHRRAHDGAVKIRPRPRCSTRRYRLTKLWISWSSAWVLKAGSCSSGF